MKDKTQSAFTLLPFGENGGAKGKEVLNEGSP